MLEQAIYAVEEPMTMVTSPFYILEDLGFFLALNSKF